jgi:hypothetical protein
VRRVELEKETGRHLSSGKEVDLKRYKVKFDGHHVAFKDEKFGSPINLVVKLNDDDIRLVSREVNEILHDDPEVNKLIGYWDHEIKSEQSEDKGELEYDIFDEG